MISTDGDKGARSRLPLKLLESSSGFRLRTGSVLSPDAALMEDPHGKALASGAVQPASISACSSGQLSGKSPRRTMRVKAA